MPMRRPRCSRTISMRVDMVKRSATRARNFWSEPPFRSGARVTVAGKAYGPASSSRSAPARPRRSLEADIPGVVQELRLNRDVQAVLDGVVELPETDHAGELDDLRWREMLLQPLQNL